MVRALWLPETSNGCQLCEAGICTFLLCFCWELPRVLVLLFHGITVADLPEVLFGFGMCCIGALGLFTVAQEVTEGLQYPDTPLVELLKRFP